MSEDDELNCVVGRIYDAALNPALWTDALAKIAEFVGGRIAGVSSRDLVSQFISAGYDFGLDLHYMQMHSETCGEFDPLSAAPLFDVGPVVGLMELTPYDEECGPPSCNEGMRSQGDVAGAVLEKPKKSCRLPSLAGSQANDMIDDEMRRRMRLLAPHARRAVLICKAIDQKANEAATFARILDHLSAGLFLIDANGRILHANAAGREILGTSDFLRAINGRLVARDAKVNRTLQDAFADGGDCEIGSKAVALPLTAQDGECHVAHVLLLGASRPGTVTAAVFVCQTALKIPSSPDVIRRAYQLTPAELRVLFAIVNGGGIPEVATTLGVAHSTVKTHVRRLFEKTGASRQADLVKQVAGFFTTLVA
jgi:DNA-binding CsgD family transcriptional regulator/PAS domain-containing protein